MSVPTINRSRNDKNNDLLSVITEKNFTYENYKIQEQKINKTL